MLPGQFALPREDVCVIMWTIWLVTCTVSVNVAFLCKLVNIAFLCDSHLLIRHLSSIAYARVFCVSNDMSIYFVVYI